MELPVNAKYAISDKYIYWTEDIKLVNSTSYRKLCDAGATCVVLNPASHSLIFDSGFMPTPKSFIEEYLSDFVDKERFDEIIQSVSGLSLKDAQNLIQLTMVRSGSISPSEIRKTRNLINGTTPGLDSLSTDLSFYDMPKEVQKWLDLNDKYFLDLSVPEKLVPRGLMVVGEPGTGKSTLSQAIAKHWKLPLFRLDISSSLTRWLGESESAIARNLMLLEQNAPCVVLLDEVEKLFINRGNEETASRILSQLLWWLQYRRARIITIMTSNDLSQIPKELYRPGRIDKVIEIKKLTFEEAVVFGLAAYRSVIGKTPTTQRAENIQESLLGSKISAIKSKFTHAEIIETIVATIKSNGWGLAEDVDG